MRRRTSCMKLRELPGRARALCAKAGAPPRLVTHLTIVHDVAASICDSLDAIFPKLAYDRDTVRMGAALHDIGKAFHRRELSGPGNRHEIAGERFLLAEGVSVPVARIARTHGQWRGEATPCLEDLLVALADKAWRGARDEQMEALIVNAITAAEAVPPYQAFSAFDRIVRSIAANADARMAMAQYI